MEAPTQKEVLNKMEWCPLEANSVGSGHTILATYEWEGIKWTPQISVVSDGAAFNLDLDRNSRKQCRTLQDAVCACADAILIQIKESVRKYEIGQEKKRRLSEYNRIGQEWSDKANSVSVED